VIFCSGSLAAEDGFVAALKQSPTRYPFCCCLLFLAYQTING